MPKGLLAEVHELQQLAADAPGEIRWMLEELRVSLFAQQLGTPYPVSAKRVLRALEQAAP